MAVTVVKRPQGYVLGSGVSACIYNDYASALIIKPGHGLRTGDYVYIKSNVENYNGFWYVSINNNDSFFIREYGAAPNVEPLVDTCDVVYYKSILAHGFQCVHLPIVYKLRSDRWPTNEINSSRTISSITDDNGLCNLNLSGILGTFNELEYVKIFNNDDFSDEVYQVVNKVSTSDITINRTYEAGLSTSGTIQLYYNNYTVYVNIYGGLDTTHFLYDKKPYELLTTFKVNPDSDNIASINIAEILKTKIRPTENSTLSQYLPNNLDFYTEFYIEVAESYDQAVNNELIESISSYTSDKNNFQGSAVNSSLPFKNIHSGHLSEYIFSSQSLIKFLNLFNPVLFTTEYYDISFINNLATSNLSTFRLKRDVYKEGLLKETFYDDISARGRGIYRKQIEQSGWSEDRIDITLQSNQINLFSYIETFSRAPGTGSAPWSRNSSFVNSTSLSRIAIGTSGSQYLIIPTSLSGDFTVVGSYTYSIVILGGSTPVTTYTVRAYSLDSSFGILQDILLDTYVDTSSSSSGTITLNETFNINPGGSYIAFTFTLDHTDVVSAILTINGNLQLRELIGLDNVIDISETQTITVNSDCSDQDIYLGWLNYLGGFEYWKFTARKDYVYDVDKSQITEKNIYTNWPNSYGEFANAVTKQISRESRKSIVVRSQYLTLEQLEGIKYIRFSPLVQIIEDKYNVTNVVVDSGSFRTYTDQDDLYSMEFTIRFTDTIPAQFE